MNSTIKWTSLTASASLHCVFNAAAKFYVSITEWQNAVTRSRNHSTAWKIVIIQEKLQVKLTSVTMLCQCVNVSPYIFRRMLLSADIWVHQILSGIYIIVIGMWSGNYISVNLFNWYNTLSVKQYHCLFSCVNVTRPIYIHIIIFWI